MDFFFNPQGIAIIGASANRLKGGWSILNNIKTGYKGGIYPVNPAYEEIEGLPCYKSIDQVPDPVDLAIVFIPARLVPQAVRDCAARGIKGVVIESGGFAETGPDGQALQAELKALAEETGVRLWGPNCMGLVDAVNRKVFSFVSSAIWGDGLDPGDVSLIVQSGMLSGAFLIDTISHKTMGISKVCSIGNKVDVNECDILEWLLEDDQTKAIGLYLEAIPQGRKFMDLCRRSTKPIVVLKGGRSKGGAKAAMSHTASLAGNNGVIDGALDQVGVVQATGFKQMMDLCRSLAAWPQPPVPAPGRVAVLTYSGGAGIISTDYMDSLNLELAELSDETKAKLAEVFPDWMPVSNPVDLWPAIERSGGVEVYNKAVEAALADPNVDALLIHVFEGGFNLQCDLKPMAKMARQVGKPMFGWLLGRRDDVRDMMSRAGQAGAPLFGEIYRAAECLSALFSGHGASKAEDTLTTPELDAGTAALLAEGSGALDEFDSKRILAAAGIPVVEECEVSSVEEALTAAAGLGWPVAMKGLVPGMVHKTEAGLVRLGLASPEQVSEAYSALAEKAGSSGRVILQKQVPAGLEMIVGLVQDAQFGPAVMCGLGGIFAEALKKIRFGVAPINQAEALKMLDRLEADNLLNGWRGQPPANRQALAQVIINLGNLALAHPEIKEVDINPLIISNGQPLAVDASVVV